MGGLSAPPSSGLLYTCENDAELVPQQEDCIPRVGVLKMMVRNSVEGQRAAMEEDKNVILVDGKGARKREIDET